MSAAKDAREQLRVWDEGETIWSIEMGGMGPGYEQALQILAVEIVRDEIDKPLPDKPPREWGDETVSRLDAKDPDGTYPCGGFSGAQAGAAKFLAYQWLKIGPAALLENPAYGERHIQVSSFWPRVPKNNAPRTATPGPCETKES